MVRVSASALLLVSGGYIREAAGARQQAHHMLSAMDAVESSQEMKVLMSELAESPCTFASNHAVTISKSSKDAFALVQEKINELAQQCAKEDGAETKIASLTETIQDADKKLSDNRASLTLALKTKDQYELDHSVVTEAMCKEAASKTGGLHKAGKAVGNFFAGAGDMITGVFASKDSKEAKKKQRDAEIEAEKAEAVKHADIASQCRLRTEHVDRVKSLEKYVLEQETRKSNLQAELQMQQGILAEAKVGIATQRQAALDEFKDVGGLMEDSLGEPKAPPQVKERDEDEDTVGEQVGLSTDALGRLAEDDDSSEDTSTFPPPVEESLDGAGTTFRLPSEESVNGEGTTLPLFREESMDGAGTTFPWKESMNGEGTTLPLFREESVNGEGTTLPLFREESMDGAGTTFPWKESVNGEETTLPLFREESTDEAGTTFPLHDALSRSYEESVNGEGTTLPLFREESMDGAGTTFPWKESMNGEGTTLPLFREEPINGAGTTFPLSREESMDGAGTTPPLVEANN